MSTLLLLAALASHTYTIQAPTDNEDGSARDVQTLDFYEFFCAPGAGQPIDTTTPVLTVPVSGPQQQVTVLLDIEGAIDCAARVTTADQTPKTSALSNTVAGAFEFSPPLAPVLSQ